MLLAWVMPWKPESEAKTAEEAQAKTRQILEQATRGLDMGDSALVKLPLPILVNPPIADRDGQPLVVESHYRGR